MDWHFEAPSTITALVWMGRWSPCRKSIMVSFWSRSEQDEPVMNSKSREAEIGFCGSAFDVGILLTRTPETR